MPDNSVLAQFTSKLAPAETPPETAGDPVDDFGAYGWLRGVRERSLMLELRKKDGGVIALGYAWLERIEFDPSEGITLKFAGQVVKITGRNLNAELRPNVRLLAGLVRHRVPWIQEADEPTLLTSQGRDVVIERIALA